MSLLSVVQEPFKARLSHHSSSHPSTVFGCFSGAVKAPFSGAPAAIQAPFSGALVALLRHHWKRHSGVVLGAVQALFAAPFQASFRADKRHHWRLRSGAISFRWEVPLRCRCRRQEGTREALPTHDAGSSKAWSAAGVGKLPC